MSTTTEIQNQHVGHQKPTIIVINGRQKEVSAKELSFVDVVRLAFEDAVFNDTTVYTVTYKRGHANKPEGTLVEGDTVKVKDGMIFNVARTDKS